MNKLFQFTPLREGRRAIAYLAVTRANFNSRPSARGDGRYAEIHGHCRYFNSRPSARGDSPTKCASCKPTSFQFTPLREGRLRT